MKFKKEDLYNLVTDDDDVEGMTLVGEPEIIDTSRWSVIYRAIFFHDGKYYETNYSCGATEMQDESPYEYEPDEIECSEVVQVTKTITVYEKVKK